MVPQDSSAVKNNAAALSPPPPIIKGWNNNIEQTFAKGKGQDDKIEMVSIELWLCDRAMTQAYHNKSYRHLTFSCWGFVDISGETSVLLSESTLRCCACGYCKRGKYTR